jgi:hypothetical protein
MMLLAGRHIYGKSHVDLIVETFLDLPVEVYYGLFRNPFLYRENIIRIF